MTVCGPVVSYVTAGPGPGGQNLVYYTVPSGMSKL